MRKGKTTSTDADTTSGTVVPPEDVSLPGPVGSAEPISTTSSEPAAAPGTSTTTGASGPSGTTTQTPTGKPLERTRFGALWVGAVVVAVLLIALVIFIAQNSEKVTIHFVGLHGHFSLAIALLVALIGGILLVAIPGSLRILQLRHTVRKQAKRS